MTAPAATEVLAGAEPLGLWRHFETLTTIARPSHGEEAAIAHVRGWAASRGFDVRQDGARNLVVRVPATAGRDSAPVVVLQGHLDMVCERRPDSPYDPAAGRIGLLRDGDWLTADGTTLGADNGVGVAAMMAPGHARGRRAARGRLVRGAAERSRLATRSRLARPRGDGAAHTSERLFREPPVVTAVPAWLETAVIGERVPGLDMVSFGPQIEAPHSPDERVSIPTVERFWRLLAGVLDELSTDPS